MTGTTRFLVTYPFSALVISTLSSSVIYLWMSSCTFFFAQYLIYLSVFLSLVDIHLFKVIFPLYSFLHTYNFGVSLALYLFYIDAIFFMV